MTYFWALYVLRVVHSLAVLKGHPECLKCGKTVWRPDLAGELAALPQTRSWWGWSWPRSLSPQIRLPKSAYVLNWTYFTPPPYNPLYNVIIVNPNSLRPYHITLFPAAGPTCSKILAPPLDLTWRDHQKCRADISRDLTTRHQIAGWTSRDLFECSSKCSQEVIATIDVPESFSDMSLNIKKIRMYSICAKISVCFIVSFSWR